MRFACGRPRNVRPRSRQPAQKSDEMEIAQVQVGGRDILQRYGIAGVSVITVLVPEGAAWSNISWRVKNKL